ncbi:acyl-CoA desaturase [Sphingobacterium sp. UT-1RO-CII-1]|uniref:fatty acid desaturase family protein n=1 Tax=Sphingobacterium sp. UT-1RO-CII-1 TaxID=2995225 RepID=UPI00227D319A|nr:acyl-CoA desaturase [Sphingobacterium sp. UT-1RO-CII-1]MCY4779342.1 acyl-CoA desaturase [Sphingobacterium sp. UT-1RO-CII-1]
MTPTIKFNNVNALFSRTLKEKTNQYFKETLQKKTGNRRIFIKATILLLTFITLYSLLVFVQPHWAISIVLCILFGVNLAAIGFNIMHDAGHNSFSESKRLNTFLSYSLNLLGGNIYFWKLKHNIAHHTYTNIDGEDHDIEVKFMRIHHDQKLRKHHRYQRFYFPLLYGISYLAWIFYQDYEKYFKQRMGHSSEKFHFPRKEKLIFWTSKTLHFGLFVVLPVLIVGWLWTLLGLLIAGAVCGISLATVFQLAHVVSETEFKTIDKAKVEEEWMIHQIQSTANFSTKSKVLTWILGGLNYQVEHHLFPKISHVHYPALNRIVRQTCQEYNIKYNEFTSFWTAFRSHVQVIHAMSR